MSRGRHSEQPVRFTAWQGWANEKNYFSVFPPKRGLCIHFFCAATQFLLSLLQNLIRRNVPAILLLLIIYSKSGWWRNGEDNFSPPRLATARPHHSLQVSHVICKGKKALLPSHITAFFFSEALNVQRNVPFGEEALSLCLRVKHCMQRQWDNLAFAYKVMPYVEVWPHLKRSCSRCLLLGTPCSSRTPC